MGILYNRYASNSVNQGYTVAIITNNAITFSGGALIQQNLSGPMTSVTLSPRETYRINQPSGGSGITVTASGNDYVISGTPTADVTITCTTTRNSDLLTATQKDVSNWVADHSAANFGYIQSVSDTRINWHIPSGSSQVIKNAAYTIELPITQVPAGDYIFEIRYRIADLEQNDHGCRVGITTNNGYTYVNNNFVCVVPILDTQTTYTNVSVPYTRKSGEYAYLAITNANWNSSYSFQGRIYLTSITLREK